MLTNVAGGGSEATTINWSSPDMVAMPLPGNPCVASSVYCLTPEAFMGDGAIGGVI